MDHARGDDPTGAEVDDALLAPIAQTARERWQARIRLAAVVVVFVALAVGLQISGWNGPEQLQDAVERAGWAGFAVFVIGYALLTTVPTPASVLTILGGALFGLWWGFVLAWAGAILGAVGGWLVGTRLGGRSVDRLLQGRLRQADLMLREHGLFAVLVLRLVPVFPFAPLNYAFGVLGVRFRHYLPATVVGLIPAVGAYTAVGAAGANPVGIVVGVGALVALALLGGTLGRRLLSRPPA